MDFSGGSSGSSGQEMENLQQSLNAVVLQLLQNQVRKTCFDKCFPSNKFPDRMSKPDHICLETILTKGLPRKAPNGTGQLLPVDYTDPKDILFREMTIEDAQIRDTLNLVYVGHFDEDYNPS
eukprot:symbB.v1.2.014010.t1/scaffold1012.1/size144332/3